MEDELDIDEIEDPHSDPFIESDDISVKTHRRFVGYKTLGFATIIAALLGAGGGAALSKLTAKSLPDLSPLQTQMEALQSESKALKAQMTRLQRDIKAKSAPAKIDLSGLETRLESLESAESADVSVLPPIDADLVARLEALQAEGSEALDLSDIMKRLHQLEDTRHEDVVADVKAALMTDERFIPNPMPSKEPETKSASLPSDIPPFPKAEILKALDKFDSSKSWIKRTLDKNITVQSEDNPRYLVDLIEVDLSDGNFEDAMSKYDKLPSIAKSAGKDWRDAIKG